MLPSLLLRLAVILSFATARGANRESRGLARKALEAVKTAPVESPKNELKLFVSEHNTFFLECFCQRRRSNCPKVAVLKELEGR